MDLDELTAIFAELGALEPESWAGSEMREGINQLGRFLFLDGLHESVLGTDPTGREMRPQPSS